MPNFEGADLSRADFLGGRIAKGRFGKGPIRPAPFVCGFCLALGLSVCWMGNLCLSVCQSV